MLFYYSMFRFAVQKLRPFRLQEANDVNGLAILLANTAVSSSGMSLVPATKMMFAYARRRNTNSLLTLKIGLRIISTSGPLQTIWNPNLTQLRRPLQTGLHLKNSEIWCPLNVKLALDSVTKRAEQSEELMGLAMRITPTARAIRCGWRQFSTHCASRTECAL